jgi:hypothetical protein
VNPSNTKLDYAQNVNRKYWCDNFHGAILAGVQLGFE